MRNFSSIVSLIIILSISLSTAACRKKEKGNCYCKYVSGDKKHFDLKSLPRDQQEDSCAVIDRNAEAFGGGCDLK
jgi:hypothetical protein